MKKKTLAFLLSGLLACTMLSACGSKNAATSEEELTDGSSEDAEDTSGELIEVEEEISEPDESVLDMIEVADEDSPEDTSDEISEESDPSSEGAILDVSEPLTGLHHAQIEVQEYGTIELELDADNAPISVTNFVKLAQEHFYDGLTFHRIISGFMIQGGDPAGNGTGGSDETIKGEFSSNGVENTISHERGVISMARAQDPDSASSQFFIVHEDSDFLDGEYAAFGHVTSGIEVVDAICADAEPVDNNGTISSEDQPVITTITILD